MLDDQQQTTGGHGPRGGPQHLRTRELDRRLQVQRGDQIEPAFGKVLARSCRWNSTRIATPSACAFFSALARTVLDTSTATTLQPRSASQMASSPWAQPRSSAAPSGSGPANLTRAPLGLPFEGRAEAR